MNLSPLASLVLVISCGSIVGTNFPPVSKQAPISFPSPQNVPLDFVPDAIVPETVSNFQPAERLPDSFIVTESTTEKSAAGDLVPNEANFPKAVADEWSPPSGTIGPVATPRPDAVDVAVPFVQEKENVQFAAPVPKQATARKSLPPSILVFSRGISGHYAEQGWFPIDTPALKEVPRPQVVSVNQNIPGSFPVFSTPLKPNVVFQPKVLPQWIPPPLSSSNIPRSVPGNIPVVIIQNVSVPFSVQPPSTVINAPFPGDVKPALFPPVDYFPKPITFPAPKTFIFPNPPVSETPATNPPVEETPAPPETTPAPPTTTQSPPPPSPPPPPPYFILPSKKEIIPLIPPLFISPTSVRFTPAQTVRPVYFPKISTGDSQLPKTFAPTQYKTPMFSPVINSWIPESNIIKSQFAPQNVWYSEFPGYKQKPVEMSTGTVTDTQTIPTLSSDLWIIKSTANAAPKSNIPPMPVSIPVGLTPKSIVPISGDVFSQIADQAIVPVGNPTRVNSSNFYRFSRFIPSPMPLLRLYYARPRQSSSSLYPTYNSEAPSQLDNFPLSYTYPYMSYPLVSQPSLGVRSVTSKVNCTTPASQDQNVVPPPTGFIVQPSAPVYLPMPQNSYSFVPIRTAAPEVPTVVFQPFPTADPKPPTVLETPEVEKKRKRQDPILAEEPLPLPPEVSAADNVVIAPIFPFLNPPVSFPKPVTTSENLKRPPYFFRYSQSDSQGALQYRNEETDSDGIVKGSYGYRGADGNFRKVDYTADSGRYGAVVRTSEPSFLSQQTSDPVNDNENSSAGSSQLKNTAESEI